MKSLKEIAVSKGLDVALSYLDKDVEKNLPKLIEWAEKIDVQGSVKVQLDVIKRIASDPDNNWYKFALNIWRNIDLEVLKTFFTNFIVIRNIEG